MTRRIFCCILFATLFCACEREVEEVEKPLTPTEGAVNARYTVGEDCTVVFAKGNLQYQASTDTWRFAANQYDIIGMDNEHLGTSYSGWIDLFGWATSGYSAIMPFADTTYNEFYGPAEADIINTNYDWGIFNSISNAGNKPGLWHVLSYDEFYHILYLRESASLKRAQATIQHVGAGGADVYGLLLLPDKWTLPDGCEFNTGSANGYNTNVYTPDQWNKMQNAGAVFLPAGGYRDGCKVSFVGDYGCYWTSSYNTSQTAYELSFMSARYEFSSSARSNGHNVRLVQYK